ncbi:DMT family transporter [Sulfoacidibacillus thermotolerans]|uniref:EamA family transporter n=1 Tax=Sulfoacidibacillus thermotolerans TaxID=1765684 RepID=A0A2U3D5Z3_SULT2|nr:DMT family transporter [Sulfoacidibacillus thermotolerans]PWI56702.1 EamA family transporter [Sulfoacidibacillus thermotolerans]
MDSNLRPKVLPLVALITLTLIWGYNWVIMKEALNDSPPLLFAALRVLIGVLVLFLILLLFKRPLTMPSWKYVLPLGLMQTTGFVGFSLWALEYGKAGQTAILVYMMPIWLLIFAWPILGERVRGLQWPALTFALFGLLCILHPWHEQRQSLGTLLAGLAGVFWASSALWQKKYAPQNVNLFSVTTWQMMFGGIALALLALFVEPIHIHWTPLFLGALLYNAIPGSALALFLWAYAVDKLPSGIAGMTTLLSPLIGVLAAWVQLGERPGTWEAWGMVLIFFALALISWQHFSASGKG